MNLTDIVREFAIAPEPWIEGRTIPWDDAEFSDRMLAEHLSQQHDGASRRTELIEKHVDLIHGTVLSNTQSRILDLGCGPGLYTTRLAELGHECLGIDFAPAAIAHARAEAKAKTLSCRFDLGDIRTADFGAGHDLVMLLYGELNLFPRDEATRLLGKCSAALRRGGNVLLEVHSFDAVRSRGHAPAKWAATASGLFSVRPHLRLDQSHWLEQQQIAVGRHWIVVAESGAVTRHGWTMQAYTDEQYEALLADSGLRLVSRFESLTGAPDGAGFPVLLASPV